MVMLETFIRLPEQQVQRPCGRGTECGTLEGQKDDSVNAEREHLSGRENCPVKRVLEISKEAGGEGLRPRRWRYLGQRSNR